MLLGMLSMGAVSCGEDDDDEPVGPDNGGAEVKNDTVKYVGDMSVEFNGASVPSDSIVVLSSYDSLGNINIDFKGVKFVPQMPVTIDITVPSVPCQKGEGVVTFQADSVVPMMGTVPADKYMARNLKGEVKGDSISFAVVFANFPTTYKGVAVKE